MGQFYQCLQSSEGMKNLIQIMQGKKLAAPPGPTCNCGGSLLNAKPLNGQILFLSSFHAHCFYYFCFIFVLSCTSIIVTVDPNLLHQLNQFTF